MSRFEIRAQFCLDGAQEAVKKGLYADKAWWYNQELHKEG